MKTVPDTIDLRRYGSTEDSQASRQADWSPEAEQSVLGSLLISNDCADDVMPIVQGTAFFNAAHRAIFEAIEAMVLANKPVDVITVHERLKREGKEDATGGLKYLQELAMSVASARNARQYAEIVRSCALRRVLISSTDQALEIAKRHADPDQALDQIATLFASIDRSASKSEPCNLADVLNHEQN